MGEFMSRLTALILVLLLAGACDSNSSDNRNLNGTWSGLGSSGGGQIQLTLNLTDTNGAVTGTSTIVSNQQSVTLSVSGTFSDPTLDIDMTGGTTAASFDARMADNGDTITGSLTGLGNPATISVKRQ